MTWNRICGKDLSLWFEMSAGGERAFSDIFHFSKVSETKDDISRNCLFVSELELRSTIGLLANFPRISKGRDHKLKDLNNPKAKP